MEPLEEEGFRKSAKVKADVHKAALTKLADELGYMSDDNLRVLRALLRTKGQGPTRDIWPSVATIVGYAEGLEPRPLEEMPGLVRWFRSVEGPKALRAGTLVETWQFFHRRKRPPLNAERLLREEAEENSRRLELYRERVRAGITVTEEEARWVEWYERQLAYCEGLVLNGGAA